MFVRLVVLSIKSNPHNLNSGFPFKLSGFQFDDVINVNDSSIMIDSAFFSKRIFNIINGEIMTTQPTLYLAIIKFD